MKTCPRCSKTHPSINFHKNSKRSDGLASWCKDCCAQNMREQYLARRNEHIAKATAWNKASPNRKRIVAKSDAKARESLSDRYVRTCIAASGGLRYSDAPSWLVALVRENLKITRELRIHE